MKELIVDLSKKQLEAFNILRDKVTTELFYGGGAGGGKSYLGCFWIIYCCLAYPGTRYLIGRARLKALKESTLLTFFMILKEFGFKKDIDYKFNSMEGIVTFDNSSTVYCKDLFHYPSDPEFDSLGSTEYTAAFVDEVSEITEKAKNIVMSRIRFKLAEFGLIPKLLLASNPAKNFAYREYWKPWMEKKLPSWRQFIPALVGDNPFISKFYAENLEKLDEKSKERLLYGNWNYDDDPSKLFEYDKIQDVFTNPENKMRETPYISADIARFGSDYLVIIVWKGLHIEKIHAVQKSTTKQAHEMIQHLANIHQVPRSNIVIDEDGVGGGVVDELPGVKGFVNNSRAFEPRTVQKFQLVKHNYANLKTQCYFKLADYVSSGKISCTELPDNFKQMIVEDLEQIKVKDPDKDGKILLVPKEEIKENLGRSCDFSDAIMMRMIFEVLPTYKPYISTR